MFTFYQPRSQLTSLYWQFAILVNPVISKYTTWQCNVTLLQTPVREICALLDGQEQEKQNKRPLSSHSKHGSPSPESTQWLQAEVE